VTYRRRHTPLHAARAAVGSAWCIVLAAVALSLEHPLLLVIVLGAVLAAATLAQVPGPVLRAIAWAVPFGLMIVLVNAVVVRDGVTVIVRGETVPWLGTLDITLEATVYGLVLGLRALIVIGIFALHSAAVDPDELLRAFRRVSFHSALTATLATRLVPTLARDARRLRDAQRCRPGEPASRVALVRAVATGALDRAVDVAATLEVRGYGAPGARPRGSGRPWSRHDLAFTASTAGLAVLGLGAWLGGWDPFEAYPLTRAPVDVSVLVLGAALLACVLAPFADRRGVGR
jgi:energy-coupling factor transport system permease protein